MLKRPFGTILPLLLLCLSPLFWLLAQEQPSEQQSEQPNEQQAPEAQNLPNPSQGANSPATTKWYRSNQLAMKLELLPDPRLLGQQQWGLEEEQSEQQRLKNLYYQGQLRETWLLIYRNGKPFQEQHKKGDTIIEDRFYDEDTGLISESSRYSDGDVEERLLYFYDPAGNITRSMSYSGQGELLRENLYRLGAVGQLVKLNIKMFSKNQELTQYQLDHLQTLVQDRNLGRGKKYQINFYDASRQNTNQIVYLDDEIQERIDFSYDPNNNVIKTVIHAQDRIEEYNYDNGQRLIQKQIWKDNALFETDLYRYDSLGRKGNKTTNYWKSNEKNEERYSYQGQSTDPQKVEYYINGQVDKIRTYSSLYEYSEELFFNGVSVAKVFYSYDDERSNEVTFENPPDPEAYDEAMEQ